MNINKMLTVGIRAKLSTERLKKQGGNSNLYCSLRTAVVPMSNLE